jgi:hypothetical protein
VATNAITVNPVLNLDDNLVNGAQYTFVMQCTNVFSNPTAATMQTDLVANAPDFLIAINVVKETGTGDSNYYNVAFTYEGDGSDVVSDVAAAMVAAFAQGSNDSFVYAVGFGANIPNYSAVSGGNSQGVTYQFDPLNVLVPVTPSQSAAYSAEATAQVQAVGTSPGGQVATAVAPVDASGQNTFTNTVTQQTNAAVSNVSQISTAANQAAAAGTTSTLMIVAAIAAAIGAFFLLSKPKFSVG